MESIGVRELRQNASKYLRRVAAGESFLVTDRGVPVAELVPPQRNGRSLYETMVARGELVPAENPDPAIWLEPPLPARPAEPPLSEVLRQLREEDRY